MERLAANAGRIVGVLVLVAIVAALVVAVLIASRPPAQVVEGWIDATEINVASKVVGRVATVPVELGQRVRAGETLFTIKSPEVAAGTNLADALEASALGALASSRGALESATAIESRARSGARAESVAALRAQWRSAASAARLAALTYRRVQALYDAQVDTREARDTALAASRSAAEQERSARALYQEAASGTRPEDVAAAGGGVQAALGQVRAAGGVLEQARAALAFSDAQVAETRIVAPGAGEITTIATHAGEIAPAGYPVVTLLDVAHPYATFNVPENLLARFAVGSVVAAKVPALDDATVRFKVYYESVLGDFATDQSTRISSGEDLRTFEVRAHPLERTADLRAGMSAVVVQ